MEALLSNLPSDASRGTSGRLLNGVRKRYVFATLAILLLIAGLGLLLGFGK